MRTLPKPPGNSSKEAVALRTAAMAFGKHACVESADQYDSVGVGLNRRLLAAATKYAKSLATCVAGRPAAEAKTP